MESLVKRINEVNGTRAVISGSAYGGLYFLYHRDMKAALDKSSIVSSTTLITDYLVAIMNVENSPYIAATINAAMFTFVQKLLGDSSYAMNFASVAGINYVVESGHNEIKKYDTNK
jgi:hypothetical protein